MDMYMVRMDTTTINFNSPIFFERLLSDIYAVSVVGQVYA
jgi:hypothetical protein